MSLPYRGEPADSSYQLSERLRKANDRIEQLEAALREWDRCHGAMEQKTRGILPGDADLYAAEKALRKLIGEA